MITRKEIIDAICGGGTPEETADRILALLPVSAVNYLDFPSAARRGGGAEGGIYVEGVLVDPQAQAYQVLCSCNGLRQTHIRGVRHCKLGGGIPGKGWAGEQDG